MAAAPLDLDALAAIVDAMSPLMSWSCEAGRHKHSVCKADGYSAGPHECVGTMLGNDEATAEGRAYAVAQLPRLLEIARAVKAWGEATVECRRLHQGIVGRAPEFTVAEVTPAEKARFRATTRLAELAAIADALAAGKVTP